MTFPTYALDAPGDGHPQLVGEGPLGKYAKCGHSHFYFSPVEPTADDDWLSNGLPLKTLWVQVDDILAPTEILGLWVSSDVSEGAAVWMPVSLGGGFSGDAGDVPFTPAGTIAATDTQAAVVEVATEAAAATAAVATALSTHEADAADAHDASAVSLLDTAGDFTATDVEGALAELFALIGTGGVTQVWEAVTDGEDVFVWEDDDLVHEWRPYP